MPNHSCNRGLNFENRIARLYKGQGKRLTQNARIEESKFLSFNEEVTDY